MTSKELYPLYPVLIVDDNRTFLDSTEATLLFNGITNLECCQDSLEVMPRLEKKQYSVILLDLKMPGISGEELLLKIAESYPDIHVIIVTGHGDEQKAADCMKKGAFYYLKKPFKDNNDVIRIIEDALKLQGTPYDVILMRKKLLFGRPGETETFSEIITTNKKILKIFEDIVMFAVTSNPVLIMGETGVGKELFAKVVHRCSQRKGNFIPINIAGADDQLFSDTLFGHKKGAFNDAYRDREGLIEQAKNGTLFLDEIGDLSEQSQVKLLRVIQEKTYYPLGSDKPTYTNARIVAATNKDLKDLHRAGKFREDLYYRLATHNIVVPSLRERVDDIRPLAEHFIKREAAELNKKITSIPPELFQLLENYAFPGNIRELENMVKDAVARHISGTLSLDVFKEKINEHTSGSPLNVETPLDKKVVFGKTLPTIDELEEVHITEAMNRAGGNQSMAAELLGIKRETLRYRLKKIEEKRGGKFLIKE